MMAAVDRFEELARLAAIETADDAAAVGDFVGSSSNVDGVITARFACLLPGYKGWQWVVDLATDGQEFTVCESALLPTEQSLLAPSWVPWSDRVRPGDLEPGMVLPFIADDPRLVPGYTATDDADRDQMAIFEFGLGRERVLAQETREFVAQRWYRGSHGPLSPQAVASTAPCSTCAFVVPLAGSFRTMFGVCTNEWSPSDGRVVSYDHGCGAHSQTDAERRASEWPSPDPLIDSGAVEPLDLNTPEPEPESEPEPEPEPESEPELEASDDTVELAVVAEEEQPTE